MSRTGGAISRCLAALCATVCVVLAYPQPSSADTFDDPGFATEVVATVPPYTLVGLAFAPDGRLFVWQKNGVIRIIKNGVMLSTPFADLSSHVNTFDDRGMWGLAFDPDFANNGYVYVTYTYEGTGDPNDSGAKTGRLTRITASPSNPDVALPGETVLMGTVSTPPCSAQPAGADCISSDGGSHTIGEVHFLNDGTLLLGVGDGGDGGTNDPLSLRAQNLNSVNGKILRFNKDGTAPSDNPFYDGTNSIRSKVWLYGVRNPFRFSVDPVTGDIWFGDVGWNTWEEIDHGVKGGNFGWPCFEGNAVQVSFQTAPECLALPPGTVKFPFVTWDHSVGSAAIGGPFYTGTLYPQQYQGSFFYADYVGHFIKRIVFDAQRNPVGSTSFATDVESPVSLEVGPDGMIYYNSFTTGEIRRIRYNGPVAVASGNPKYGYSPLTVSFSSVGSLNPGGGTLTYLWNFGDGATSTAANPIHSYTSSSVLSLQARLTVTNSAGLTSTSTVPIVVGSVPPVPTIAAPVDGTTVLPGQTVTYQGSATDPDEGALPPSALRWTVLLHHNTHVHTFVAGTGSSGSFVAEDHGPIGTFSYEIILEATDSSGLKSTTSVTIPVGADTTPPSTPTGLVASAPNWDRAQLSWSTSTDNAAVTAYRVERCQGVGCSTFAQVADVTTSSYLDLGLAASTSYSYRVVAVDAAGNVSGYSSVVSVATPAAPPVPAGLVLGFSFDAGSGSSVADVSGSGNTGSVVGASWSAQGRYGGAMSFNGAGSVVQVASSSSLGLSGAMTLSAWIDPAVSQSGWRTIMQRQVDAYFLNASSDSGALRPAGGGTFGGSVSTVDGPTASPVGSWTHVALTYNGTQLLLYVNGVQVASKAVSGLIQSSSSPLWIGGNQPYGEYFSGLIDDVRVYNRALSQAEIQTDIATPLGGASSDTSPPSVPLNVVASAVSSSQVGVSWSASTDNVGVTGYRVERCQGVGCSTFAQVGAPSGTSFGDTGLSASTTYRYRVRAVDAAGNLSGYSSAVSVTTPAVSDTLPPSVPGGVVASAVSSSQVGVSWSASTDNVGVTGYRVERCLGVGCSTFAQVGAPSGTSFSDTGLSASTSYSYRVVAVDAAGNVSGYSSVVSVATPAAPPVPAGLVLGFSFDAGSGSSVADVSGSGNTGSVVGASWSAQGRYGGAMSFNGAGSVVQVASSSSLGLSGAMTLSAWIDPAVSQSGWRTIMQRQVDAYFLNASSDSGALRPAGGGTFGGSVSTVDGPTASPVGSWTHVALTYDGTQLLLYVNGVQVASKAVSGLIQSSSSPLWIGGNQPYGEYFSGLIDDVRVYNRALSQAEIQTDIATPLGGASSDTSPPSVPLNVVASAVSSSQVGVSWSASTDNVGVTGYRVERCQGVGCSTFAQVGAPSGTSFSDTGLSGSTSYSYRLVAVDAAGNASAYSAVASVTTMPVSDTLPPSVPLNVVASAVSSSQVGVSWSASTDNVGVTGYRVERCQGVGCSTFAQVGAPTGTSFSDTGLSGSTSYSYRVVAVDAAGNASGYSALASATTQAASDTSPPSAPTNVVASAVSSSQVNLSWTASTDNVGVTGYRVERCQGSGCTTFAQVGTPAGTTFSDTGLSASTLYRYRVRAADAAGNLGVYSSIVNATTQTAGDTTPPSAPTSLAGTVVSSSQVNLSWTASTDNVGVTGYRVERCQGSGCTSFAQVGTPTGTTFSDTGLSASTLYRYRVRAADAAGNLGAYSSIVNATTQTAGDTTPPSAPTNLAGTAVSTSQINLSWTASTDNVGVTGYRVERCQGQNCNTFAQIATPTGTTFGDSGLAANTYYRYRVRAADAAGNLSAYSSIVRVRTLAPDTTAPSVPSNVVASAVSSSQVGVSWSASTDNVGVTGYRVERCQGVGCSTFAQVGAPSGTSFGDTGLSASTTYRYRVRAVDAAGNLSGYSSAVSVTTPAVSDTLPPSVPGGVVASAVSSSQVGVSWSASTDNVGVTGYRVERCLGVGCSTFAQVGAPSGTSFSDTGLSASTSYSYRVVAVDAAGNVSGYSSVVSVATPAAPPVPAGLVLGFSFDAGSGSSVADVSGSGNTGSVVGASWSAQGRYGGAMSFNGAGSVVQVASSSSLGLSGAMTLSAWIDPAVSQSGWRTIMQRQVDAYFLNASNDSGALRPAGGGTFGGSVSTVDGPTASPVGSWTHVALTYDGTQLLLYVNGVQVASKAVSGLIQSSSSPLWIGGNQPYGEYFNGLIDDVRVYNRALSQTEIQTDMATPLP